MKLPESRQHGNGLSKVALDKHQVEFTIAICTLNRRLLLERAAREVLAQLDDFPHAQLLIVDNGSTDGSAD
jgi:glycosyltransferase involved in cell wall biosynthesis